MTSVLSDWNFKHLFTGVQVRWPQKGTRRRRRDLPHCPVLGWGRWHSTEGLKCLGMVSQRPRAAVPKPFWNLALAGTFSAP